MQFEGAKGTDVESVRDAMGGKSGKVKWGVVVAVGSGQQRAMTRCVRSESNSSVCGMRLSTGD